MHVTIIGAGKVGRSFACALGKTKHRVVLWPARRGVPRERLVAGLVLLAVRDSEIATWATGLTEVVTKRTAVAHVAGALGPDVLAPLRGVTAGVAQAHPAVSFPSRRAAPDLRGASLLVAGDAVAVRRVSTVGRAMGLVPRAGGTVDPPSYHAACALAANGAAALADVAVRLLVQAGIPAEQAPALIGPLLRTVGENVHRLGVPEALSGPLRRGDAAALRRHLDRLRDQAPDLIPLYLELARAQLTMARALGEAPPAHFDAIAAQLTRTGRRP